MSHSYFSQRLISSSSMDTRKFCVTDISGRQYRKSGRPERDSQLIDGVIRWLFQSLANLWSSSLIRSMLQNLRHSTWNTHFKLHNSSTAVIYSPVCAISKPSLCHKKFGPLPFYWRLYSLCLNLSSTPSGSKILSVSYSFFSDHQVMVDHESLPHRLITDITSSGLKLSLSMRFMTVKRLDTCFLYVKPLRASIYLYCLELRLWLCISRRHDRVSFSWYSRFK